MQSITGSLLRVACNSVYKYMYCTGCGTETGEYKNNYIYVDTVFEFIMVL
jgi:hypothetical protein